MMKIEALCSKFGLENLFIKDESQNIFGTWKDRVSKLIVEKAKNQSVDKFCLITSGNAGFSLANFANQFGIKTVCIVDVKVAPSIKRALGRVSSAIVEVNLSDRQLTSQEIISLGRANDRELIWDVTNGWEQAYESIIEELKDENPDYLICPVGSGQGFIGLLGGLEKWHLKTKLIGVTPVANPSVADKLYASWTPYREKIKTSSKEGHQLISLSEEEIISAFSDVKNFIDCEPSSAAVVGALSKLNFEKHEKIVLINSGRGLM